MAACTGGYWLAKDTLCNAFSQYPNLLKFFVEGTLWLTAGPIVISLMTTGAKDLLICALEGGLIVEGIGAVKRIYNEQDLLDWCGRGSPKRGQPTQ